MEKKTLILHIGQSKTGASSIQKFCQKNRANLAACGISYPSVKKNGVDVNLLEHNAFAETVCGISRYPYLAFEDYISQFQGGKILLSAESFWGTPHIWTLNSPDEFLSAHRAKLEKLREWTKNFHLEIILYLRHPLEWFKSSVSHIIRHEGLLGKKIYQSDEQLYELLKPHMDYLSLISLWNEVLQPDKFTIKAFDRQQLVNTDAVADFCSHIGYNGTPTKELEENAGWPAEITLLKKELNERSKPKWKECAIIEILNKLANSYSGAAYDISEELQRKIINDMGGQLEILANKYQIIFAECFVKSRRQIDKETLVVTRKNFNSEYRSVRGWGAVMTQLFKRALRQHFTTPYNLLKTAVGKA
jgi:hypothetical protein